MALNKVQLYGNDINIKVKKMVDNPSTGFIDDRVGKQVESLKNMPATIRKNYFEVDPKTKEYVRKFANVVEIDNERAVLRIDGEDWSIPSAYDLLDLVEGEWILGFAFPGLDGLKKFYPLGPDNQFLESRDARNVCLPTDAASVGDAPEVKAETARQNDLKAQLLRLAGEIAGVHATTTEFGQALGQIIQNAINITKAVTPATGQANAAMVTGTEKTPAGRAPVVVRPRDAVAGDNSGKQSKKSRGRGMARVRSHFKGEK